MASKAFLKLSLCINIMSCKSYCIDETMIIVTKKVNKHICQGYSVPLLLLILYQMSLSADKFLFQIITKGCKNDRTGLVPSPASCIYTCRKSFMQKQVKKKAFKINAKIEDVGLNED